jgi:CubicO group peptidase (beta-lactamase class C family)
MNALELIDTWPVPHAATAVVSADVVLGERGATGDAMPLASVTKPLAAYATLIAVEEGAIDLDEPAGPPGATVRHLLAHTAGYAFESGSPALSRPGAKRIYSNQGFEVLQAHVEERSGIPFGDYVAEAVFAPLGMRASTLRGSAAHAATSSVDDLAAFARELLAPSLISPQLWQEFTSVQFPGLSGVLPGHGRFDPLDWGLGVERNYGRQGHWAGTTISRSAFGHFGRAGTFLWVDPVARLAGVGVSGRDFGPWAFEAWTPLVDAVLRELAPAAGAPAGGVPTGADPAAGEPNQDSSRRDDFAAESRG